MKKWFNFLAHAVSVEYCDNCYAKMIPSENKHYYLMPMENIQHFQIPEEEEFYLQHLKKVSSLQEIPNSRHYAERQDFTCPNCGKHYVVFYIYLKVRENSTLYGAVNFPYQIAYDEF